MVWGASEDKERKKETAETTRKSLDLHPPPTKFNAKNKLNHNLYQVPQASMITIAGEGVEANDGSWDNTVVYNGACLMLL